jgi:hypothetical protein
VTISDPAELPWGKGTRARCNPDLARWAWGYQPPPPWRLLSGVERAVLLAVTAFASDEGDAWPSVSTLMMMSGYSRRAVQGAISSLSLRGVFSVLRSVGGAARSSNRYKLTLTGARPAPQPARELRGGDASRALRPRTPSTRMKEEEKREGRTPPARVRAAVVRVEQGRCAVAGHRFQDSGYCAGCGVRDDQV